MGGVDLCISAKPSPPKATTTRAIIATVLFFMNILSHIDAYNERNGRGRILLQEAVIRIHASKFVYNGDCNVMDTKPLSTDAMNDSPEDFEGMYEINQPLIYKFIFWRTQDKMLAQDLTSSVFEKAWRTRHNFKGGSAKSWLLRIARTTLIDHWRLRKSIVDDEVVSGAIDSHAELGESLDLEMRVEKMHIAVEKLPRQMHEVVELRFIQGLSTRDTAKILGVSEANARVLQFRALKKLRDYLQ